MAGVLNNAERLMTEDLQRWLRHGLMTDPGGEAVRLDDLPADIGALCRIIQGVLIHSDWMPAYGLPEPADPACRTTLPLAERLRLIADRSPQPLTVRRPSSARSVGTCRDFALMLGGILRHQGTPARVRCGFAAYFDKGRWEDHWVCEYRLPGEAHWRRADPQLDEILKERLAIGFDTTDVPPDMFVTAGEAWRRCRTKQSDPCAFGQGAARGLWFVRVNVVRDHYALNDSETSAWDSWRRAIGLHELVTESDQEATDVVATHPENAATTVIAPPWLA
jgi:hypothetical protein